MVFFFLSIENTSFRRWKSYLCKYILILMSKVKYNFVFKILLTLKTRVCLYLKQSAYSDIQEEDEVWKAREVKK